MRISPRFLLGAAIAVLSLLAGAFFWNRAFPTAALQFSITEAAAEAKSREFLKLIGHDLKGYLAATQFGEDGTEKNFIEKEYGLPTLEKKVSEGVNIWYWTTRFFKPEQEEEISVAYDPQGHFVGLFHTIPEKAKRPFLTREQARVVAEDFLKQHVTQHPFAKLRLVEDSSKKLPNRTDYYFTWEQDDLRLGDATYQLHATVKGDKVGSYNENVKVPEAWILKYRTQRSTNAVFQQIAQSASVPIMIGMAVLFVLYVSKHRLRWRTAIPYRWLILFGVVELAATWNNLPDIYSNYPTTEKWGSYLFTQVGGSLLGTVATLLGAYLLSLVADAIYREQLPDKLSFSRAMGRNSLYQPETVRGLGVGIVLACFGIGYVCTFYVVANHFGAWSPVEIDYSKIIGGPIPWISGMQVGMSASWTEEFTYRIVGILLYWKLLRGRYKWIGLVVACATWAFLHSNYPQMPGYLRGCELTAEGILWGAAMVRFGIVATLTGHYLYDCWLSSFVVFQSADPLNQFGAVLVSVWPILLWMVGVHYQRTGQTPPELPEEVDEAHPTTVPEEPTLAWNFQPFILTRVQRVIFLITAGLIFLVQETGDMPYRPMEDYGHITLSRQEIANAADKILRERGQDPSTYHRIVSLRSNSTANDYLSEHGTPDEIAALFETEWPDLVWNIRYFRVRQREEFNLTLDYDGKLVKWRHTLPREAHGASLEKAAALELAKQHLVQNYGVDFNNEKLVEDRLTQQLHRRDYYFSWEREDWDWGDSRLRTQIAIQGDEPVNFTRYVKVPDEWNREQEKKYGGWKDAILGQISSWSSLVIGGLVIIAFVILLRRGIIPWKAGFLISLAPTALVIIEKLNSLPWFYSGYSTTTPLNHYLLQRIGGDAVSLTYSWLNYGARLSVVLGLMAWAFGWKLSDLRWPKFDWPTLRRSMPDFFALLLLSLALLWVTTYFETWLTFVTEEKPNLSFDYPSVNVAVPWLATLINAVQSGYDTVLRYAFVASIAVLLHRRWPRVVWSLLLLYPAYSALHADTVHEFIRETAMSEFHWLLAIFLVWKLWRFDAALIFAVTALRYLLPEIALFAEKGGPAYENQAWPLSIAAVAIVALAWWLRSATPEPAVETTLADENSKPA